MTTAAENLPNLDDFDNWVDAHAPALVAFAKRRLRDARLAEEAVQETFLAAWRGRGAFAGRSSVSTWLHGILRRKIVDTVRHESRLMTAGSEEQSLDDLFDDEDHYRAQMLPWDGDPQRDYARQELWQSFQVCLDALPKRLAQVFVLREVEGLERDEICGTLGVSSSNYWVMLHRARLKLRECFESRWLGGVE